MKKSILLLLLFFFAIQSFAQEHKINISIDTTYIKLKQITKPAVNIYLKNAVKFNNKYYCIINESSLINSYGDINRFIIISEKGDSLEEVELPYKFIHSSYSDLFIYKDRVTIKDYYDAITYYLDTIQNKWIETEEADDLIYEDEEFYVTYMDFGEWGSTTWFRDKKTNKEYDIVGFPNVLRLNGKFYLIGDGVIYILDDVFKLNPCREDYYYNKLKENSSKIDIEGSGNFSNLIECFRDTNNDPYSFFENKFSIISSFISDNKLYHICSDTIKNYIGYVSNKNMLIIDTLPSNINLFNSSHSYRCKIQKDNSQIIKFNQKEDKNQFGFIEIKNNNVKIRYFIHDIDSVNYIGKERFEMAFESIFNNLINNKDITISQIDSLENIYGGLDTKFNYSKSHLENSNHKYKGGKNYFKIQDSIISNSIDYYYTENDSLVKYIFIEWTKTPIYKTYIQDFYFMDESPYKKDFDIQFKEILKKITTKLGKPKIEKGEYITDYIWEKIGVFNLSLERKDDEEIRIYFYKD